MAVLLVVVTMFVPTVLVVMVGGGESQSGSISAIGMAVLSTLVAVSGSYVFGTTVKL